MQFKSYVWICSLWLISMLNFSASKPTSSLFDNYADSLERIESSYYAPYQQPITDYHLSRLRRGYYYVEDGFITAVPASAIVASRRVDATINDDGDSVIPLVKHKRTHNKRKKLFVPNLFG